MDYRNMIPGMKVKGSRFYGGDNIYIVRLLTRDNEQHMDKNQCVVNDDINTKEGYYEKADILTLLELPKSFDKREQVKNYTVYNDEDEDDD